MARRQPTAAELRYQARDQELQFKHGRIAINCANGYTTSELERVVQGLQYLSAVENARGDALTEKMDEDNKCLVLKIRSALNYRKDLEATDGL